MSKVVEVGPELAPDRFVQAELAAKRSNGRRRRMQAEQGPGGVAGDQPQEQEGDDDYAEHNRNREKDPAHDIAQAWAREIPAREPRSPLGRAESGSQVSCEGTDGLVVAELSSAA